MLDIKRVSLIVLTILVFTGCGAAISVINNGQIDTKNKSIYIPGNGEFFGQLRQEFKNKKWAVSTQIGTTKTVGTNDGQVSLNTGMNYRTRYTITCSYGTYWDFGTKYIVNCTTFDNQLGQDVQNISIQRTEFEMYSLQEATAKIVDSLESVKTESTEVSQQHVSIEGYTVVDLTKTTYFSNGIWYNKSNKLPLTGNFQHNEQNGFYTLISYTNGNTTKQETYYPMGKLYSKSIYQNNKAIGKEIYYDSGALKASIPYSEQRDKDGYLIVEGTGEFYTETGDLHYQVTFLNGKAIKGLIYKDGKAQTMTKAHFRNLGLDN